MTEQDLIIQDLRRENEALKSELEWKQKEIIHRPTKSEFKRMATQLGYEQVERGKWVAEGSVIRCSVCGAYRNAYWSTSRRYCPNCGARMEDAE